MKLVCFQLPQTLLLVHVTISPTQTNVKITFTPSLALSIPFFTLQVKQSWKHKLILVNTVLKTLPLHVGWIPDSSIWSYTQKSLHTQLVPCSTFPSYWLSLHPTSLYEAIITGVIFVLLKLLDDCLPYLINSKRAVTVSILVHSYRPSGQLKASHTKSI